MGMPVYVCAEVMFSPQELNSDRGIRFTPGACRAKTRAQTRCCFAEADVSHGHPLVFILFREIENQPKLRHWVLLMRKTVIHNLETTATYSDPPIAKTQLRPLLYASPLSTQGPSSSRVLAKAAVKNVLTAFLTRTGGNKSADITITLRSFDFRENLCPSRHFSHQFPNCATVYAAPEAPPTAGSGDTDTVLRRRAMIIGRNFSAAI